MASADSPESRLPPAIAHSRIVWFSCRPYPTFVGFCPSEAAWRREMRRIGAPFDPYPQADAACNRYEHAGSRYLLVTIGEQASARSCIDVAASLVHEAVHVWQRLQEHIGQHERPGNEVEAYAIEQISRDLLMAYAKTRLTSSAA